MRAVGVAAGIALIGVAVAGCGGTSTPQAATTTSAAPKAVLASPNTIGLCGGVSDAEVGRQAGLADPARVSVNALSCVWQPGSGGDAVIFHWFRGSSLEERRTQVTTGKPATVQVAGQAGIEWRDASGCEVAVAFGDTDFIDWTVRHTVPGGSNTQSCPGVEALAAATLQQAGQG
ncbi:DUF3558 family protein [Nocardia sp. NPDC059240]|uniref:DUF3558 family protein n=1 Tax=Nocardia sp. NPDC059240 TaxID=3346786 RepID=UPI0036A55ABC